MKNLIQWLSLSGAVHEKGLHRDPIRASGRFRAPVPRYAPITHRADARPGVRARGETARVGL